jgi:hypothetical protein
MEEHIMRKRVFLLVTLLALVIMGFTMNVEAAEIVDRGYCGGEGDGTNLTWTLDQDGVLVIEGQGRMRDWTCEELWNIKEEFYDNPSDYAGWHKCFVYGMWTDYGINMIIVKDGVTSIGECAFYDCRSLDSIDLPESLTSIGDNAFSGCDSLSSIDLPRSLTSIGEGAFSGCDSLSSIDLPESLTSTGDNAFSGCDSLSSINLPESLTSIGEGAFSGCDSLSSINLPESLTSIGDRAFSYCEGLSSIVLPESLTSIGDEAFGFCYSLRGINLPESLISIGDAAFEHCYRLSNVRLPESLTSIGDGAFKFCYELDSIYIPVSVGTIYQDTFAYSHLKDIYYGGTKKQWDDIEIVQGNSDDIDYDILINATIHYADSDSDDEKLSDFVSRLYRNFLNREPDEKGLADWVDVLRSGKGTGAKVVSGFVLSPEYKANSLSNEEYITALYRIIFDREPDTAGLNAWLAVMENGYTNKKVLAGFVNSDEFESLCRDLGVARGSYHSDDIIDQNVKIASFVKRLYTICLGRSYDQEGLDNWVRALASKTVTGSSVVWAFFGSREFDDRDLERESFVIIAYRAILGRDPDMEGFKNFVQMGSGGVIDCMVRSVEFNNLCIGYGIKR